VELVQLGAQFGVNVLPFARELKVRLHIGQTVGQFLIGGQRFRQPLAGRQNSLRSFLVLPELGLGYLFLNEVQFLAARWSVKENSGWRRTVSSVHQIRVVFLRSQGLLKSCQSSVVSRQLSVISRQFSVFSHQSVIGIPARFQESEFGSQEAGFRI
jgi:hypothetical protein